jgi:hypothetical protein
MPKPRDVDNTRKKTLRRARLTSDNPTSARPSGLAREYISQAEVLEKNEKP